MGNANSQPLIEVDYSNYIGKGSFGYVYRGTYGKQPVAVKTINLHMLKDEYKNIDKNEVIPFIKGLKHPNIVTIFAWEDKGHEIWLALELCDGGLDKYLKDHDPSTTQTWDIIWQCANGLCYLHRNNVIHRDVKPDNFLVVMENGRAVIKVTDFSLCKDVDSELGSTMATVRGNKHWLAPELLTEDGKRAKDIRYKRSVDIFSFALVIIYVLVNNKGREKFSGACCGAKVKKDGDVFCLFNELWRNTDLKDMYMKLLERMLELDPEIRSTMEDVMSALRPPIASTAPRLVLQTSHRLSYLTDCHVGIGGRHLILLSCYPHTLRLFQLQGDGYKQLWKKDCPVGMSYDHRKYVAGDESLIGRHDWYSDQTWCWSRDLAPLHMHTVGYGRVLIAVLPPPYKLTYREKIGRGFELVRYDGERRGGILRPPAGTRWGANLSICQHPGSGWMASTDHDTRTLTVFDRSGQPQHHARLDYEPGWYDAITSTDSHLVVSERITTILHLHTWDGKEMGRMDLRQVVKLGEEDSVWSVGVCEGDVLHVAVGDYRVSSLHALKIE